MANTMKGLYMFTFISTKSRLISEIICMLRFVQKTLCREC